MRDANSFFIRELPSGGYKAYVWGQPDYHIMDWRGCNYRYKVVDGPMESHQQPRRGYKTPEEAESFLRQRFVDRNEAMKWAAYCGDGTFLTDDFFDSAVKFISMTELFE